MDSQILLIEIESTHQTPAGVALGMDPGPSDSTAPSYNPHTVAVVLMRPDGSNVNVTAEFGANLSVVLQGLTTPDVPLGTRLFVPARLAPELQPWVPS